MDLQPTLKGILITLTPLALNDFDTIYSIGRDPEIWAQHPNHDRYVRKNFERYFQGAVDSKGAFKVNDNETGKIIGCTRYYNFDPKQKMVMIGYTFLATNFWGGSYNREMKELMINHAFEYVDRIYFEVGSQNMRSQKALQKIGAKFLKETLNEELPHHVYEMTKHSWNG